MRAFIWILGPHCFGSSPANEAANEVACKAAGSQRELSGATEQQTQTAQAQQCATETDSVYIVFKNSWPHMSHLDGIEYVGVCLSKHCVDSDGQLSQNAVDYLSGADWLREILERRCRDGHPQLRYLWPDYQTNYTSWYDRAVGRLNDDTWRLCSRESIKECPGAACAVYSNLLFDLKGIPKQVDDIRELKQRLDICYEELVTDMHQLMLFGLLGFNLGAIELSQAKVRAWGDKIKPRNPHHDDGRVVWRDHYSGLYSMVNYSEQFDMQWRLALEDPKGPFGEESSCRLDDCAINDMIESTFGERQFLAGCDRNQRAAHEEKERGISRRNFMLLDIENFKGSKALDVGCGFGRWTAMMLRLGANVTSVDASPHAVKSTRRYNPEQTFQMSLFDLGNSEHFKESFDFVVCWGVLHHTHDPLAAFKIVASMVREGGILFVQVYNDHSKAAYPFTYRLRSLFHSLKTNDERIQFLLKTHAGAGSDVFDHLDGMLTFYNWVVHEEVVRDWFLKNGFADYWKVWNYKYMGRKRSLERPVRDDSGYLLSDDLGESQSGVRYYPIIT